MSDRKYTRLHMIIARAMEQAVGYKMPLATLVFIGMSEEYDKNDVERAIVDMIGDGIIWKDPDHTVRWVAS